MTTMTYGKEGFADLLAMLDDFDFECEEGNPTFIRLTAKYSERNAALILIQNPEATHVGTFKYWLSQGRCVRKGEKSMKILAPAGSKTEEKENKETEEKESKTRKFFRHLSVFDVAQTDELEEE